MLSEAEEIELLALLEDEESAARAEHEAREAIRLQTERAAIVAKCQSLHGFIEEFWYVLEPTAKFVSGWAIRAMCDHLEAVHRGDIRNLLITVPPGTMKSLLVSVFFQCWEWGPMGRPDLRYLATSFSDENVTRDSDKVRKLLESPKYRELWGDQVQPGQRWGVYKFTNSAGGERDCRSFGSLTGGRGDRVLIDDPHSVRTAESDTQREETVRLYREGATDRLNDISRSATIVIMQRIHQKDVAGEIISLDVGFVHLNLPMEFERSRRCRTILRPANDGQPAVVFEDPRQAEGELLFPERFPGPEVERLKRIKGPYAWAGQYQQRPGSRTGGMFQRSWFNRYSPRDLPAVHKFGTSDYAVSADSGDFTVLRIWGVDENSDLWLLPGGYRAQATSDKWIAAQVALIKRHQPFAWFGEGGVIQKAVEPMLIQAMRKAEAYTQLVWLPSIASKATRARGFQSRAACGAVWIPEGPEGDSIIEEYAAFLNGGPHDDDVDNGSLIGRALDEAHPAIPAIKPQKKTPGDRWANEENDDSSDWKTA